MHLPSTLLLSAATLAISALAACQQTTPTKPVATPSSTTTPKATPAPQLASNEHPLVTLGPVTGQAVLVDQVGYLPTYPKIGLVVIDQNASAETFQIVGMASSRSVFEAQLGPAVRDPDTGKTVRQADFSAFTEAGSYTLVVPGFGRSPQFRIGNDVYAQLGREALD